MEPDVILVTGSSPPDPCGVGDYTQRLCTALAAAGVQVELFCHRRWDLRGSLQCAATLARFRQSILHMQYPTMGYGYSIGPQLCALSLPCVVTLHEFRAARLPRKISLLPFTIAASRILLTSETEKSALARRMPWARSRLRVIPIGSNIEPVPYCPDENLPRIVYFGLIMPRKGLEEFLEFARIMRARHFPGRLEIIGKVPVQHRRYASNLREISLPLGIDWILDRDAASVSQLLARAALGYLPFPDGATERRGSIKALCAAGVPCITTQSEMTPDDLREAVQFAAHPGSAAECALRILQDREQRQRLSAAALRFSSAFTWGKIAEAHIRIYSELRAKAAAR
jgi:glycosyltransferase involved in cell wall biosynthesis